MLQGEVYVHVYVYIWVCAHCVYVCAYVCTCVCHVPKPNFWCHLFTLESGSHNNCLPGWHRIGVGGLTDNYRG